MGTVLVIGAETVAGANLAAVLEQHGKVVAVRSRDPAPADAATDGDPVHQRLQFATRQLAQLRPQRLVYCGRSAWSSWSVPPVRRSDLACVGELRAWAMAAAHAGCPLTVISSDCIFTGPRLFHSEAEKRFCSSPAAALTRAMERQALALSPNALVLRSHVVGWSPKNAPIRWLESLLDDLAEGRTPPLAAGSYATPISATHLAELIMLAWKRDLRGIVHMAGAERISQHRFVERLALRFGLNPPRVRPRALGADSHDSVDAVRETSLDCRLLRRRLGVALPQVADLLDELGRQQTNGFRETIAQSLSHPLDAAA